MSFLFKRLMFCGVSCCATAAVFSLAVPALAASISAAPSAAISTMSTHTEMRPTYVQGAPVPCDTDTCSINEGETLPLLPDAPISGDMSEGLDTPGSEEMPSVNPADTKAVKTLEKNLKLKAD